MVQKKLIVGDSSDSRMESSFLRVCSINIFGKGFKYTNLMWLVAVSVLIRHPFLFHSLHFKPFLDPGLEDVGPNPSPVFLCGDGFLSHALLHAGRAMGHGEEVEVDSDRDGGVQFPRAGRRT